MPRIQVNGVELHYDEVGSGPETVVFSHSYLLDGRHFSRQMEAFQNQYRCIAFDHRGHGRSEVTPEGYDLENLYQDAVEFIEALDLAPCHFVGLSTGGFIGLRIALRRPALLKSLVLMDTSADPEPEENLGQYKLLKWVVRLLGWWPVINKVLPIFFTKKWLKDPARRDEVAFFKSVIKSQNRTAMVKFGRAIFSRQGVSDQIDRIATPTLVMVGEQDQATTPDKARRMADRIPGAGLVTIPRTGHICTVEDPTAVNAALAGFLAGPR
ncbi:MAG: alpha/beta hydrolase [Proteobacteria bacterium]|nr:alpha/beta hydrolase [Pseudomonadota bacterium]MBU1740849.1 alpha/beta hydrolase [Pseudomonadota bacterium]